LKCQGLFPAAAVLVIWGTACASSAALPAAAARPSPASEDTATASEEETGTVRKVGDFGFGLVPDRDPGTRYAPDNLPESFRKDGLRVAWIGKETEPPEGVRMWGTPYHVEKIRLLE
jgi:hypothetical protein